MRNDEIRRSLKHGLTQINGLSGVISHRVEEEADSGLEDRSLDVGDKQIEQVSGPRRLGVKENPKRARLQMAISIQIYEIDRILKTQYVIQVRRAKMSPHVEILPVGTGGFILAKSGEYAKRMGHAMGRLFVPKWLRK